MLKDGTLPEGYKGHDSERGNYDYDKHYDIKHNEEEDYEYVEKKHWFFWKKTVRQKKSSTWNFTCNGCYQSKCSKKITSIDRWGFLTVRYTCPKCGWIWDRVE